MTDDLLKTHKIFSCYGGTLAHLVEHIKCCKKYYPDSIISDNIQINSQSIVQKYTVRMLVSLPYKHKCPKIKVCERK